MSAHRNSIHPLVSPARPRFAAWLASLLFFSILASFSPGLLAAGAEGAADAAPWWNKEWTARKSITITPAGGAEPDGPAVTLLRLHEGNFQFAAAKEDGSDIRLVAGDGKTEIPYHLERYDGLMNEAFLWAKVPEVKAGGPTTVWLYYGNSGAAAVGSAKDTFPESTVLAYHFGETGAPAKDYSAKGNNAATPSPTTEGALIGAGIRLLGGNGIQIPNSDSLAWTAGQKLTLSIWVKPAAKAKDAIIFSREENGAAFRLGVNDGVPYVEVADASGPARSAPGELLAEGSWRHLAVVAGGGKVDLLLDGKPYGSVAKSLPAMVAPAYVGGDPAKGGGFQGEADELQIHNDMVAPGTLRYAAVSQSGSDEAGKLLSIGGDEAGAAATHNEALEHLALFGDIAKNMMFDGWVVIFCCCIMAIVGWAVAIKKFLHLNRIQKGSNEFLRQWKNVANDLTALDHADPESVKSLGGSASPKKQKLMRKSPLYHIYHIGSEEIQSRIKAAKGSFTGLSLRSIQAIKASLDSGLTHEAHRLNNGLVFLTISIAGGPYVGLLGTVVGVMVTFAVIAKSGEVEVNSIAPGIASALLATVAGLLVAIPALFIYSYLNSRIKDALSNMQIFIDEFITKIAEFYPETTPVQNHPNAQRHAVEKEVVR